MTGSCLDENTALELFEGRLPSALRAGVERHLVGCDACRELVAELSKDIGMPSAEEPAAATERIPKAAAEGILAPGTHVGPYRIEAPVGSGSAGVVYRATDRRSSAVVALKYVTDPGYTARFAREAQTLARLRHDAIVRYIDHGSIDGGLYLVMDWLEGEDLKSRLERGPLGWEGARLVGLRLAGALEHAHALGAIHRDLSPRNVFLPGGRLELAKLLDFGLVRTDEAQLVQTATHAVLGTPFYMSPEQIRDPKRVTVQSDLFALGTLLYEACCGTRPFGGDDLFSVWRNIVETPAPDLGTAAGAWIPDPFAAVVHALLAKDPAARPGSAGEVRHRLEAIHLDPGRTAAIVPLAPPLTMPPARALSAPPGRRRAHVLVVLGVAAASVVAAGTLGYVRYGKPKPLPTSSRIDEPKPEPAPATKATPKPTFPLACSDGETIAISGDWAGAGPIISTLADNCTVHIRNAKLKGAVFFATGAGNVTVSLEDVAVETTSDAVLAGTNFTLSMVRSSIRAAGRAIETGTNFELTATEASIESANGPGIFTKANAKMRLVGATLRAKGIALETSTGMHLTIIRGALVSREAGAIESDGGELDLVGTAVTASSAALLLGNGAHLRASAKTSIRSTRGDGVVATTNADIRLDDASLDAERMAVRTTTNTAIRLVHGARVTGKGGGVDTGVNFELDALASTIDGAGGPGIRTPGATRIVFRGGTLRGVPALQIERRPPRLELEGAQVVGAISVPAR